MQLFRFFLVLFETNLHYIWCKFSIIIITKTEISTGAIWDEFSEKHQDQKKAQYLLPNLHFFSSNYNK